MNGELAQIIAIATHGSMWLRDRRSVDLNAFVAGNSTFQYVAHMNFDGAGALPEWLAARADDGVERLWLAHAPLAADGGPLSPHLAAAFAGGGSGAILAPGSRTSTMWRATWGVTDRDAPDRRIWSATYRYLEVDVAPVRPAVEATANRLVEALKAARAFAAEMSLGHWASWFAEALSQWEEPGRTPKFHADLFPPGLFEERAVRLASMAQSSYVFGGMGSWNDLMFDGAAERRTYADVSSELYAAMLEGFAAAVNSDLGT
jgi:hypothetical protein